MFEKTKPSSNNKAIKVVIFSSLADSHCHDFRPDQTITKSRAVRQENLYTQDILHNYGSSRDNLPRSWVVPCRPFENSGLVSQPLVSLSSRDICGPTSIPPRHRPMSSAHTRSVSTSQIHFSASGDTVLEEGSSSPGEPNTETNNTAQQEHRKTRHKCFWPENSISIYSTYTQHTCTPTLHGSLQLLLFQPVSCWQHSVELVKVR